MAIAAVIHTNQQSIDRVLNAGLPVLLVFWQPQNPLAPTVDRALERLAEGLAGKVLIAKVNAAEEKELVRRFNVAQTPMLVLMRNGNVEVRLTGDANEDDIRAWLSFATGSGPRPAQPQPAHGDGNGKPVILTDANFQQVINGPGPVLVDFWAPWCGPCRMVAPSVEQLAKGFRDVAVVGKLNVDENPQTQQRYRIVSIPALYIFKKGQVVDQMVGAQPLQVLQQHLQRQVEQR